MANLKLKRKIGSTYKKCKQNYNLNIKEKYWKHSFNENGIELIFIDFIQIYKKTINNPNRVKVE